MEEAPQGTFEDELEWCIRQLETGLLRRNPTPKQASDAQRVLQVLRSRKAPFVKKRAVMNRVFGNYRLKMAEERKSQHTAAEPPDAHIEEGAAQYSQSICYRKCSKDTPGSPSGLFSASGNTFSFDFCIDNLEQDTEGGSGDVEDSRNHNQGTSIPPGANTGFSFNFQISEDTASPLPSSGLLDAAEKTNVVTGTESGGKSEVETSITGSAGPASEPVKPEGAGKGSVDPPRRKKKKKKGPKERSQGIVQKGGKSEAAAEITTNASQDASQSGAEELRRELDWCVEQLEMGLQRQKSTAKQVEESLRAIKTLRSEKAPLVKKRQVMRAMFGDYRRKMEEEKQKQLRLLQIAAQTARVTEVPDVQRRKNSKVFRQSSHSACKPTDTNPSPPVVDSQAEPPATTDGRAFLFRPAQEPFCFNFQL